MTIKPSAERQRKLVAQRKQAGLKRIELWAYPEAEVLIRSFANALNQTTWKRREESK